MATPFEGMGRTNTAILLGCMRVDWPTGRAPMIIEVQNGPRTDTQRLLASVTDSGKRLAQKEEGKCRGLCDMSDHSVAAL